MSCRRLSFSNHLTSLDGDWGHTIGTLANAFFGDNSIADIPSNFVNFKSLVWLNLDNNNIQKLDESSLPPNIHTLSLNNNLLKAFPTSVSTLKDLTWLYLRGNSMRVLKLPSFRSTSLELIDVSDNLIEHVAMNSPNFTVRVRDLNLASNRLSSLGVDTFENIQTKRIHISSNGMRSVHVDAFRGLEESLEYLNMENNEMIAVPTAIRDLKRISYLYLANNKIVNVLDDSFHGFGDNLKALSLAMNGLKQVPIGALAKCRQLLHLNLGYNRIFHIEPGEFEWAENLEILLLRNNVLTKLRTETFKGAGRLKELSLSFNHLTEIDDDAFLGVENSLDILELSFAFATDVFPYHALRPLTNLLWLVLDNNHFQSIGMTAFHAFQKLRYINLESNRLHHLSDGVFHSSIHPELRDIKLGYNFLESVPRKTFQNLTELRSLDMTGNRIRTLAPGTITFCPKLVTVSLAHNKIARMEKYAFRRLPGLQFLHLEFNRLTVLDLNAITESGASDFTLNVSFNAIGLINLGDESTITTMMDNLTHLDLSFNNLTHLSSDAFSRVPNLRTVDLHNNYVSSIEPGIFTQLKRLESMNLKNNRLEVMRGQAFVGLEALQLLDISGNLLFQLTVEQFRNLRKLRILNLSRNRLRSLPRAVFEGTRIEVLDLSENKFSTVPSTSLVEVGYTLRVLNLADNFIDHLDSTAFPISSLTSLNLACNRLTILPDNSFVALGKLLNLNISHNSLQANFKELFHYLPDLRQLCLASCSLRRIPVLPLNGLSTLDLSFNDIELVSNKDLQYLDALKSLRLTNNSLTSMPIVRLNFLRELDVSGNPIEELKKGSLRNYPMLERLNLKDLSRMSSVDKDALRPLQFLKHLQIQTWPQANGFDLRVLLSDLPLHTVEVQVTERLLGHQIQNAFSKQLKELIITGHNLEAVAPEAFSSIEGGELILRIKNTRVQRFQSDIFLSLTKRLSQLTLDLRNNNINELSPSIIYGNLSWEAVGTNMVAGGLQVSGNPLECDCEIAWLSLWLRRWLRESRQIHTASQSDARQLRSIAGRAVCTEITPYYSSDKVLLTLGTPHTACQASALSSGNYKHGRTWHSFVEFIALVLLVTK